MDFAPSARTDELAGRLELFMDEHVYPAEPVYRDQLREPGAASRRPPVMDELTSVARAGGLWNLFLPDPELGAGLTNLEYAPLAEITGRSFIAPEAINCAAPDTGNMEILAQFGSDEQRARWLAPLLEGEIRSCFAMTEPEVASSDASNIRSRIERDGDQYVINARKWWVSGAGAERCRVAILMGQTDPGADPYQRQSMVLVPMDAAGVRVVRPLSVFGYEDPPGGHCELVLEDVRVPVSNRLGEEGSGFAIAQARLGPGRIHHCMRALGMAERALELACERARTRAAFGRLLAEQGAVQEQIALSRIEIEQARLLVLKTAWLMDTVGNRGARTEIAAIKVAAPRVACRVIDRAIQVHGGAGFSADFPLAQMYAHARTLRMADGPDEVHLMSVARRELRRA